MRIPAAIALVALLLAGCRQDSVAPSGTDIADLPADQIVIGIQHTMTENGVKTAILFGDTAYLHESTERWDLVGVRSQFFDETGRQSGHLTSETGEYNSQTGDFVARGNVVLVTQGEDGTREIRTEELYYELAEDRLWSEVPVVIIENGRTTRGNSFRYNAATETWTIADAQTSGGSVSNQELRF